MTEIPKNPSSEPEKNKLDYIEHFEELVEPFVLGVAGKANIALNIAEILSMSVEERFNIIRQSNMHAYLAYGLIVNVRDAMRSKRISDAAPWFAELKEKMLALEIFAMDAEASMDLSEGKEEFDRQIEKGEKGLRRRLNEREKETEDEQE